MVEDSLVAFFCKQTTGYESCISDASSDVCSSDLCSCPSSHSVDRGLGALLLQGICRRVRPTTLCRARMRPRLGVSDACLPTAPHRQCLRPDCLVNRPLRRGSSRQG